MKLGAWQLDTISGGTFRLDGGTMFGPVPRVLWERRSRPDALNRIPLATHCVLARDGTHTVLIDTGYGGTFGTRQREQMKLEAGEPLLESLSALGVGAEQIDTVILSHLHFDHVGGATGRCFDGESGDNEDGGRDPCVTFPRARHVVHADEWDDALGDAPELKGSYPTDELRVLAEKAAIERVEQDGHIVVPGITVQRTGGHTRGHMLVRIESEDQSAVYIADICPTLAHLRMAWQMAYDQFPLETRRCKPRLLGQAADSGSWVLLCHDPEVAACRLQRDPRHEFIAAETRTHL